MSSFCLEAPAFGGLHLLTISLLFSIECVENSCFTAHYVITHVVIVLRNYFIPRLLSLLVRNLAGRLIRNLIVERLGLFFATPPRAYYLLISKRWNQFSSLHTVQIESPSCYFNLQYSLLIWCKSQYNEFNHVFENTNFSPSSRWRTITFSICVYYEGFTCSTRNKNYDFIYLNQNVMENSR